MKTSLGLSDLDDDLLLCKTHLETTNTKGTQIESFLTRFLLVHICGEYEKEIKRIMIERAQQSGDLALSSYVEKSIERVRNIKTGDLRGNILNRFSENCLVFFNSRIKDTESEARYNNIITNRDYGAAHGGIINITFDELLISHNKAKEVLQVVSDALNHI